MKKLALLATLIFSVTFLSPNVVLSETWICGYEVHGETKLLRLERTPKGFKSKYIIEIIEPILSETERRIVLVSDHVESVFVTILDKKHSEFISSGVFAPAQLRRGGAKMDTHKFKFNQGKCEIID